MGIPNSFLLDEVRCGFLIPAAVKQAWAAELEVLMEIDRVCRKHNIQYFADWGTLLGTVRHGGFVPWDDDLDIVMKREDYQKFMNVARLDMEEGFHVQTYHNQKDFWLFMGKVVGKNRFCFEKEHLRRFHNFPYIACVDIFVLDYVYRDPEKEEERRTLCKYMLGVADAIVEGRLSAQERELSLQTIEEMSGRNIHRITDPVEMGRYLYGEVEEIFAEVPASESDTLTQLFPWGLKGNAHHFPKEYYEQQIYLPFECTTMPVPLFYDKMLRLRYGDYMKPIKDAGAHNYPFFEGQKVNLQKVLDFPLPEFRFDRQKLCRSEEEKGYKNLSYKVMAQECVSELWRMKNEMLTGIGWIYEAWGDKSLCEGRQREMLQRAYEQYCTQLNDMENTRMEQVLDLFQNSQQLAIDMGTMLEQILGEDSRMIHLLEQYCEALFMLYEEVMAYVGCAEMISEDVNEMSENDTVHLIENEETASIHSLNRIQEEITCELKVILQRKAVLFLPVLAKDWNGLHSLWQAVAEDPDCDAYVLPLPYYYKDYDGSPREVCCDASEFPEEVCGLDSSLLTEEYLEMLHPEQIIIQNPYDAWNPAISVANIFYAENIRKYTDELVYVSPFVVEEYTRENARDYSNMKYYVTMPGVIYADRVVVQSENMKQQYVNKLAEFAGEDTRRIWEERIMAVELLIQDGKVAFREDIFEACVQNEERASVNPESENANEACLQPQIAHKKKILYGLSVGTYMEDPEAARRKIEKNFEIFSEYREEVEVTIHIFPEEQLEHGIGNIVLDMIRNNQAIQLYRAEKDCVREFDAYYGDPMPLAMDFHSMRKPVMIQNISL